MNVWFSEPDEYIRFVCFKARILDIVKECEKNLIIYKYSALLEAYDNEGKYVGDNIKKSKQIVKFKEFLIDRIIEYGEIEYRRQKAEMYPDKARLRRDYDRKIEQLWNKMVKCGYVKTEETENIMDKMEILAKTFTYMYH